MPGCCYACALDLAVHDSFDRSPDLRPAVALPTRKMVVPASTFLAGRQLTNPSTSDAWPLAKRAPPGSWQRGSSHGPRAAAADGLADDCFGRHDASRVATAAGKWRLSPVSQRVAQSRRRAGRHHGCVGTHPLGSAKDTRQPVDRDDEDVLVDALDAPLTNEAHHALRAVACPPLPAP